MTIIMPLRVRQSQVFFDELQIPEPDVNLGVDLGSHGKQTGQMLLEEVISEYLPLSMVNDGVSLIINSQLETWRLI